MHLSDKGEKPERFSKALKTLGDRITFDPNAVENFTYLKETGQELIFFYPGLTAKDKFDEGERAFSIMCAAANTRRDEGTPATFNVVTENPGINREVECPQSPAEDFSEWIAVLVRVCAL